MKILGNFLILGLVLSLIFACQQEDLNLVEQEPDYDARIEQYVQDYIERHGHSGSVEYTSLEELNEHLIARGLPPTSLEELGLTPEQYEAAQERIKKMENGTLVEGRCDDAIYDILGDIDGDGELTSLDIAIAQQVILGNSTQAPGLFECISDECGSDISPGCVLTTFDLVVAQRILLGVPCDELC